MFINSTPSVKNSEKYIKPFGISIWAASKISVKPIRIRKQSANISRDGYLSIISLILEE